MANPFEEYAVLDARIKELTGKKDELKAKILEDMIERGEDKAATSVGSFTIAKLKVWTYTNQVAMAEEEFKAIKALEESTGEATFVEKPSLRFTQISF
jgi:hypothetical protein